MPANILVAGMARSYGCPAKSFSDIRGIFSVITSAASNIRRSMASAWRRA